MEDTLISIIVPVYKVGAYLDTCVQSLLAQTYKKLDILLIDDGSPDDCGRRCDEWAAQDQRIRAFHKTNGGLSDARNYGLQHMNGSKVMFVDADDYIAPDMVAKLYAAMVADKAKLVICEFNWVDEAGNSVESPNETFMARETFTNEEIPQLLTLERKGGWRYIPVWNKLYDAAIWSDLQFPYQKLHEDEFVIQEVLRRSPRITVIPDKLYYYVKRDKSITAKPSNKRSLDVVEAYMLRARYMFGQGWDVTATQWVRFGLTYFMSLDVAALTDEERQRGLALLAQCGQLRDSKGNTPIGGKELLVVKLFLKNAVLAKLVKKYWSR